MEAAHVWGEDLELTPTTLPVYVGGAYIDPWDATRALPLEPYYVDLKLVSGVQQGQQRVLRRLLTAPAELVFHAGYGAGLPAYVGQAANVRRLRSLIRDQMLLEAAVAADPLPEATMEQRYETLFCQVRYTAAEVGTAQLLQFDVGA